MATLVFYPTWWIPEVQPLSAIQEEARVSETPYFVYVYKDKDRQCRRMERKTWKDQALASYIDNNYLAARINPSAEDFDVMWIQEHEVFSYPTVLFFSPYGQLLGKASGANTLFNALLINKVFFCNAPMSKRFLPVLIFAQ